MGYIRFWKRIKIFPGIYLNIGKGSFSFSFGPKGFKYTKGTKGDRISAGIPGTGIYYIEQHKNNSATKTANENLQQQSNDELEKELKGS